MRIQLILACLIAVNTLTKLEPSKELTKIVSETLPVSELVFVQKDIITIEKGSK